MLDLKGRNAIITGAGSGIGKAMAVLFAQQGCNIGINDIDERKVKRTVEAIKQKTSVKTIPLVGDITQYDKVEEMTKFALKEFSSIDILINNAGYGEEVDFENITLDRWKKMMDVHLNGSFYWIKSVVPKMKAQRYGKIVNMSSGFALVGAAKWAHYCAAKSGLLGLTKALARELAPYNINVNAIAPGTVNTDIHWWWSEKDKLERGKRVPLGRQADPGEIAFLALYLVSREGEFITGQVISPNGGEIIVGI